jgi:beta-phosphoglucomutase
MKKFEWIFFDLDGTLANSLDVMYDVYEEFLKNFNIEGNYKEFHQLMGPSIDEIVVILKKKYNLKLPPSDLTIQYNHIIGQVYPKKVRPMKGSSLLLKKLFLKNYKLALVTSASREIAKQFLKQNNWMKYFSIVVSGDDVNFAKPNPSIYQLCLSLSGANKNQILVVEDSENGSKSARKAGLNCILVDGKKITLNSILTIC